MLSRAGLVTEQLDFPRPTGEARPGRIQPFADSQKASRELQPIDVCITIDVEFSIGGAFTYPLQRTPVGRAMVDCVVDGQCNGLGFILSVLGNYGIPATFFVEALQSTYFGDGPMSDIAQTILSAGQDIQLHLHPEWTAFGAPDWRERVRISRPNDSCAGRDLEELCELIELGISTFRRWGVQRPIALRAGSFKADQVVYQAMRQLNLPLASNLGVAHTKPDDPSLDLRGGLHRIADVIEAPATTYYAHMGQLRPGWRLFTITASSFAETRCLLDMAWRQQVSPIVIVTHPFEFIKRADTQFRDLAPNRLTQSRLKRLSGFLADNRARFRPLSFSAAVEPWSARGESENPRLTVPATTALCRAVQNKLNDLLWIL